MENIMYEKKCTECGEIQSYKNQHQLNLATKLNKVCRKCAASSKNRLNKIAQTKLEKYGSSTYNNRDKAVETTLERYGVENVAQNDEIKQKVTDKGRYYSRIDVSGKNNPHYGYTHTEEAKRMQRIRRVDSLLNKKQCFPAYNKSSISIIEAKAKELGITDLQHAENGGEYHIKELGYFVDGYSKEKNIVIEYDEIHHFDTDGNLRETDIKREQEITDYLNCEFIRVKEILK